MITLMWPLSRTLIQSCFIQDNMGLNETQCRSKRLLGREEGLISSQQQPILRNHLEAYVDSS